MRQYIVLKSEHIGLFSPAQRMYGHQNIVCQYVEISWTRLSIAYRVHGYQDIIRNPLSLIVNQLDQTQHCLEHIQSPEIDQTVYRAKQSNQSKLKEDVEQNSIRLFSLTCLIILMTVCQSKAKCSPMLKLKRSSFLSSDRCLIGTRHSNNDTQFKWLICDTRQHNNSIEFHYTECCVSFFVMLGVVILNAMAPVQQHWDLVTY